MDEHTNEGDNDTLTPSGDGATGYSVDELAEQGGVPVRTVRFYIAQGVLPGPGSRGRAATYSEEHLVRLRLIRRLAERRVPLTEISAMLAPLTLEEARALLAEEEQHAVMLQQAAEEPSPKEYIAALLSRAQAARQPGERTAAQAPGRAERGSLDRGLGPPISGQPYIAQPPRGYVPRPLGPTPPPAQPAQMPPHAPEIKSYPRRETRFPWKGSRPGKDRAPADSEPASAWKRWELAPGVELHVRAEAVERYRELIRRLLRAAGLSER